MVDRDLRSTAEQAGSTVEQGTGAGFKLGLGMVAIATYLLLATFLPNHPSAQIEERGTTAAAVEEDPHAGEECEHGAVGHDCGLSAKAMLSSFQKSIQKAKGIVHTVVEVEGVASVKGEIVIGWDGTGADLEELTTRYEATILRLGTGYALISREFEIPALLEALRSEPSVGYAEPNMVARCALVPNDPFFAVTGNKNAGLEQAWDVTTGAANVVVAVLDTGADTSHPDLTNRLVAGFDFVNNTAVITDDNGHGTAMSGIVAAEGQNNEGVTGVAFTSRVMPVKVADGQGQASVANVVAGIDFAIQNQARVINLSLGAPVGSQAMQAAINRALAANIVVIASAGNDPVHHEVFPAAYPGVVSVTALGPDGKLGFDAVLAEGVEVGAPGEQVVTTLPGDVYGFVTGSSAGAAFASGVAALSISVDPTLTGPQVAHVLQNAQVAIPELAPVHPTYRFGQLDAKLAVDRSTAGYVDIAVTDIVSYPAKPIPGQAAIVVLEVSNEGNVALTNRVVRLARILVGTTARIEIGFQVINTLAVGERRLLTFNYTAPAAGSYTLRATASTPPGETEIADNQRDLITTMAAGAVADVRVVSRKITSPVAPALTVTVDVTLENRGTAAATNVAVQADVMPAGATATPPAAAIPAGAGGLGIQTIPTLAVGQRTTLQYTYTIPNPPPAGIQRLRVNAAPLTGEVSVFDNTAFLDFQVGTSTTLKGLYQQSNGVDIIPDAPWRIAPNRPYVPVQVFVASKGGRTSTTKLRVTQTTIGVRDTPTGASTNLYTDVNGAAPSATPAGLEVVDEVGNVRTTGMDLFGDQEMTINGRHEIFRIPVAALGATPGGDKYVDVDVDWEQRRIVLWLFRKTRDGDHKSVMKVHFAQDDFPSLPGDNHYHDVHHHTIAEWYFGSALDIFAPRKAYGGPLQMVYETGYALGILPGATAQDAYMRIITTDHSSFNNRTTPSPDGADHRPPFGPQSLSAQPGTTQLEAFRNLFGRCAGEEIAFKQNIPGPRIPFVNKILNMLPGIPLGAHMLVYGADHVEGPWHGGGWLKGPGNPNIDVNLFPLLNGFAKNNQGTQGDTFSYAAHPFGGMGWNDSNFDGAFGLDPANRTRDGVHDATNKFVVKGIEFFNGRGTRSLPSAAIDFNDLNPWADPDFQTGEPNWDKGLWDGVTIWHEGLAKTLEYSFNSDPDVRLIRKIYQAGGSDAHGDFNFSTGRAATPLNLKMTYNVGDEAWYKVRTYCFGEGKSGTTAEDRWFDAYRDGNSVVTDGPLVTFELDAQPRFDSATMTWHDQAPSFENSDGRIGGHGAYDGGFTALVERGSLNPSFRYQYSSNAEFGPVASLLLYKTEAGNPNPTRRRQSGFLGFTSYDQITGVNELALSGAGAWQDHAFDAAKEGPVTKNTAFTLGAYTVGNPDQADLGINSYRCWTNPIYAVAYDVTVDGNNTSATEIPAGQMTVTFSFDISMDATPYVVEIAALDANGDSVAGPARTTLVPQGGGSGWSDQPGIKSSVLTLTNSDNISLSGDQYPAGSNQMTFVIYFKDAPRDYAGNDLNRIATTFQTSHVAGSGSGGGVAPTGSSSTSPSSSSTAPGATGATPTGSSRRRSSSGGLCSLDTTNNTPWHTPWALLLVLGALAGLRLRLR
jgi:subtilisin family serine protease